MNLTKIDDKAKYTEVYHVICTAAEEFYRLSVNIPKALLEVVQHIHGRFDSALQQCFKAANILEPNKKLMLLRNASSDIFFQYSSLEYLIKVHAITAAGANRVLEVLRKAYIQIKKWYSSALKVCGPQKI